jgi:DnaJ-class molecular chaperone
METLKETLTMFSPNPSMLEDVPDPYQVLGVSSLASQEEIKRAFRRLAQKLHPDVNQGDDAPTKKFHLITAAYEILNDKEKRHLFDEHIRAMRTQQEEEDEEEDDEEEMISPAFRGKNVTYAIHIPFLKAVLGGPHSIETGESNEKIKFMIPSGCEDEHKITLKGRGQPSTKKTGIPGNAHILISVEAHALFRKYGRDIVADLPLSVDEALLGTKISVPSLRTPLSITIPANSNTDDIIRVQNEGVPASRRSEGGDLLYRIKIMLPEAGNAPLSRTIKQWREETAGYKVRDERYIT